MRCRWYFKHEPSSNFINVLVLRPKSQWKPPAGNPCVELFLSRLEEELFLFLSGNPQSYNPTKEKWKAMSNLAEDRWIIVKPDNKGSCFVIWDWDDCLAEVYRQVSGHSTYTAGEKFNQKIMSDFTEKSYRIF